MLEKIRDTLKGARYIEITALIVFLALLGLCLLNSSENQTASSNISLESRLETILSHIDGVRSPKVIVSESSDGNTVGVVVVAQYGENIKTRLNIQNAIATLLNIDVGKIQIISKK